MTTSQPVPGRALRAAAAGCALFSGLGFGLPGVAGLRHFARTGEVWTFMGFPTYGDGPFESVGIATSSGLIGGFVAVCAAEVALAALIAAGHRRAQVLSLALVPAELVFWIGFALPFGPVLGVARVGLLAGAEAQRRQGVRVAR